MSNYLSKVADRINASEDAESIVDDINKLELPESPTALEALIYGECLQLESVRELGKLSPEDEEDPAEEAKVILSKVKTYQRDLEDGFEFRYQFKICATYQHFLEETMGVEYLRIFKDSESQKIKQAVKDSEDWSNSLPQKLAIYEGEERPCLLVSVKPTYQVIAMKGNTDKLVSEGVIEFGNEKDINTRENNLI